jgi:ribosomal protein S18 acetylase RimI-like enzyme
VRILSTQFEMFVSHAVKHGAVHTIDDDAVAVWFDNTYDAPWIDQYDERMAALVGELAPRFATFDATLAQHHPHHRPHHHLALLAVRPGSQGQGLGGRLLSHHQRVLDQHGIGAFLEASSLSSRALYLRNGFEPFGEHPYYLPEDGPPMWPMWRAPATGVEPS